MNDVSRPWSECELHNLDEVVGKSLSLSFCLFSEILEDIV